MIGKVLLALAFACSTSEIVSAATDKVVCYHGTWSTYRPSNGKFSVADIDPSLCTHLIYSFVGIQDDGNIRNLDPNLDVNRGNIKSFNALKQANKKLKTLVAIGGWNEGSERYSKVAADPVKRATLIKSAVSFLKTWGFDGFDLDWEYPGQRGGASTDKQNYAILIKEFRKEFDKHGFLLTAAVAASAGSVDISYDVPALSKYLDLINVMAYDFHGSWDGVTGQNAPLYPSSVDTSYNQKLLNVDAAIRGWIQRGADPQKLSLGLGVYGRSYTLADPNRNKVGSPTTGAGNRGPYTQEAGMLGYNEIVEFQKQGGWATVWDDQQKTPYIYKGNQWVGFDDPKSIAVKVDFAKSLNLGAVMIWSIETDDFRGVSGVKYPILRAINKALGGTSNVNPDPQPEDPPVLPDEEPPVLPDEEPPVLPDEEPPVLPDEEPPVLPEEEPEVIPEPEPKPVPQPSGNICRKVGYVRDPVVCSKFYYCLAHNGGFVPLPLSCQAGLVFDEKIVACNWPSLVQC